MLAKLAVFLGGFTSLGASAPSSLSRKAYFIRQSRLPSSLTLKLIFAIVKNRGDRMRNDELNTQSMGFAVSIINLVKELKAKHETIIANQIGRSGTSIGANIREAQYAHGRADFISKLQIALKEANETSYWLELLYRTNSIDEREYKDLESACSNIRIMLISSLKTAKANSQKA